MTGGYNSEFKPVQNAYILNMNDKTLVEKDFMWIRRAGHTCVKYQDKVLIIGGISS